MGKKQKFNISCKNITLDTFIDCQLNGNLRRLSDTATDEELTEIWNNICEEYSQISGDNQVSLLFRTLKSVYVIQTKIAVYSMLVNNLNEAKKELLNKIGYKGDIKKIISLVKKDRLLLETKLKELERVHGKEEHETTEEDYTRWILEVSKYIGYRIDRNIITVFEFLQASKLMENEIKIKNKWRKK